MKVIAFNGSPRKKWNTSTLLQHALDGAASMGAETELVNLYDYKFTGCKSCFACKLKDGKSYGRCALKDDLEQFLEKVNTADALLIGSPIYIGNVTSLTRGLIERLLYPYAVYDHFHTMLFTRRIPVGFIYTMNVPDMLLATEPYGLKFAEEAFVRTFGPTEVLHVTDTYQFTDYSKYVCPLFNPEAKAKRREEQFPIDCQNAFDMGVRMVKYYEDPEAYGNVHPLSLR